MDVVLGSVVEKDGEVTVTGGWPQEWGEFYKPRPHIHFQEDVLPVLSAWLESDSKKNNKNDEEGNERHTKRMPPGWVSNSLVSSFEWTGRKPTTATSSSSKFALTPPKVCQTFNRQQAATLHYPSTLHKKN